MPMKHTLPELFKTEPCVLAPEIYDCASAHAVELCGYQATVLSGAELAMAQLGVPDLGLLSLDESIAATRRICNFSSLPMVVDAENGYGPPLNTYNACKAYAKAGAGGVIIVDSPETRVGGALPFEQALEKYRAAAAALKGTDCILVARTDVPDDLDEAIWRCQKYREAGADMTLVFMINYLEAKDRFDACKRIAEKDKGWKWYPDLGAHDGKSDVTLEEIAPYGFNFVGIHYLLGSAMKAMIDCGEHNYVNKNNVYFYDKYNYSALTDKKINEHWIGIEQSFCVTEEEKEAVRMRWPYYGMH